MSSEVLKLPWQWCIYYNHSLSFQRIGRPGWAGRGGEGDRWIICFEGLVRGRQERSSGLNLWITYRLLLPSMQSLYLGLSFWSAGGVIKRTKASICVHWVGLLREEKCVGIVALCRGMHYCASTSLCLSVRDLRQPQITIFVYTNISALFSRNINKSIPPAANFFVFPLHLDWYVAHEAALGLLLRVQMNV